MKEPGLTDLIDKSILQQFQDAFSEFTGMAALITDEELNEEYIIPKAFDPRVGPAVAAAVAEAARRSGVARI